ncbi:MAG: MarR family transcriptional regulator [Chloroflexi bacterium]|nr:MarR family transcriptional regulator [Chloroflexota bacterium]
MTLALPANISPELRRLVEALQRFYAAAAADSMQLWVNLDMTMPQMAALHVIWQNRRVNGRQLADHLHVSPPAVVKVCDRLEAGHFIRRVRDASDRRVQWLELTESGAAMFQRLGAVKREHLAPALRGLPPAEQDHLAVLLDTLANALQAGASFKMGSR